MGPLAFASRYLNDAEENSSIRELELLAVVWEKEKSSFYLCGNVVHLYTDHQDLEPLIKCNRAYRQYSARLTRWSDRLAHFDISMKHTEGKNLVLMDYWSRHPTEEAKTGGTHDEEYVIKIVSELFKLNHKYGQFLKRDRKVRQPTNQQTWR